MRLGVKTHWRDNETAVRLARKHGAAVLEYQMLHDDLARQDEAAGVFLPYRGEFELRVHQPITIDVEGRRVFLDPSSVDERIREASVVALGECARHAMELRAKALIIHPGGIHRPGEPAGTPETFEESLADIPRHVRILVENMPAHYGPHHEAPVWTRSAEGLLQFAERIDGYVLDTSHAYLARPAGSQAHVLSLARALGKRIRHVHAAGSRGGIGHAGEGAPFGESDYGVDLLGEACRAVHPDAAIVVETMGGHLEDGRLFDEDLARVAPVVLNR